MSKRDPLKDLIALRERVNRLFEHTHGSVGSTGEALSGGTWSPAVDIYETAAEFLVEAEVPEVQQGDIDIRVKEHMLTIEGERRPQETLKEGYHRIERSYGRFQRSFLLPDSVDTENIQAALRDGVLEVTLPKKGESAKKHVAIDESQP